MVSWLPIETAPKDGTPVLLYAPSDYYEDHRIVGYFNKNYSFEGDWVDAGSQGTALAKPTHWMPLPGPPPNYGNK